MADWKPTTGAGLYRWAIEQEDATGLGVRRYLRRWGRRRGWPENIIRWDHHQVEAGLAEARRAIAEYLG